MKYRLFELLDCPECGGNLRVAPGSIEPVYNPEVTVRTFECSDCYRIGGMDCSSCIKEEIVSGRITCASCSGQWEIESAIPRFYGEPYGTKQPKFSFYQETLGGISKRDIDSVWGLIIPPNLPKDWFKGLTVLDVGCGDALFDITLNSLRQAEILAFDIDPVLYTIPERYDANMHFIRASVTSLPLKRRRFDFVYSVYVLHYLEDMWSEIEKVEGLVKDRGRLTLSLYPYRGALFEILSKSLRRILVPLPKKLRRCILYLMVPFIPLIGALSGVSASKAGFRRCADLLEEFFGPRFLHMVKDKELEQWLHCKGYSEIVRLYHPVTYSGCKNEN
ncbi:MAG: class I SAM-dependent methyltransferase [Bacillota bacterium]